MPTIRYRRIWWSHVHRFNITLLNQSITCLLFRDIRVSTSQPVSFYLLVLPSSTYDTIPCRWLLRDSRRERRCYYYLWSVTYRRFVDSIVHSSVNLRPMCRSLFLVWFALSSRQFSYLIGVLLISPPTTPTSREVFHCKAVILYHSALKRLLAASLRWWTLPAYLTLNQFLKTTVQIQFVPSHTLPSSYMPTIDFAPFSRPTSEVRGHSILPPSVLNWTPQITPCGTFDVNVSFLWAPNRKMLPRLMWNGSRAIWILPIS